MNSFSLNSLTYYVRHYKENEILDSLLVDSQPEILCKTRSYQL